MNKIIGGKRYNTETAELIDSYSKFSGSFEYIHEELYRKRTGEFFLYGKGGPRSKYAERVEQNTWQGGEDITPLTEAEAKAWLEKHSDAEHYEACFDVIDEMPSVLRVDLAPSEMARLRQAALRDGRSIADVVRQLIALKLD